MHPLKLNFNPPKNSAISLVGKKWVSNVYPTASRYRVNSRSCNTTLVYDNMDICDRSVVGVPPCEFGLELQITFCSMTLSFVWQICSCFRGTLFGLYRNIKCAKLINFTRPSNTCQTRDTFSFTHRQKISNLSLLTLPTTLNLRQLNL